MYIETFRVKIINISIDGYSVFPPADLYFVQQNFDVSVVDGCNSNDFRLRLRLRSFTLSEQINVLFTLINDNDQRKLLCIFFLSAKEVAGRYCFYLCLSVHKGGGAWFSSIHHR